MPAVVLTNEMIPTPLRVRSLYFRTSVEGDCNLTVTKFIYPRAVYSFIISICQQCAQNGRRTFTCTRQETGESFEVGRMKLCPQLRG